MRALVLQGGNSKGSFQTGVLSALGQDFDVVAGTSVGAINGYMIATGQLDTLIKIWENITKEDVFKSPPALLLVWKYIKYKIGIGSPLISLKNSEPLEDLLRNFEKTPEIPFYAGRVSLEDGKYYSKTDGDVISQVMASAAIPGILPPVDGFVDGGLRNILPIKDVIKHNPSKIIAILTEPLDGGYNRDYPKDILDILDASIGVMTTEVLENDIREDVDIIEPPHNLGSGMDYSRKTLDERIQLGIDVGRDYLENGNA